MFSDPAVSGDILVTMTLTNDLELLVEFSRDQSEDAFTELVQRYLNLVYCAALRQVRSPQLAEEVAQSVFTDLARNASRLKPDTIVTAWLYEVTRRTAIDVVRSEARRRLREQISFEMNAMNANTDDWMQIEPLLDEAMHGLDDTDRTAVLLRYFENKSLREVGRTLGTTDDTARKRVNRALERLREFFAERGVTVGTSGLVVVISANAVQAAPVGLTITVSAAAALAGKTTTTAWVTKAIAMTTVQKALITAALAAAVGTGIYETRQASILRAEVRTLQQKGPPDEQIQQQAGDRDDAARQLAALRDENERLNRNSTELLKLRGEVTRLRTASSDNPTELAAKAWLSRVIQLKQRLAQTPEWNIPEIKFISERDWLDAAQGELKTDGDYRKALSALRKVAEGEFASMTTAALKKYSQENNGQFPAQLSQLNPYFKSPVDDTVFQRWKIAPAKDFRFVPESAGEWIFTEKMPVDEAYDTRFAIGIDGVSSRGPSLTPSEISVGAISPEAMRALLKSFFANSGGQDLTDISQLLPFVTTQEHRAALDSLIQASKTMSPEQRAEMQKGFQRFYKAQTGLDTK